MKQYETQQNIKSSIKEFLRTLIFECDCRFLVLTTLVFTATDN